jgi:hypothetical protein
MASSEEGIELIAGEVVEREISERGTTGAEAEVVGGGRPRRRRQAMLKWELERKKEECVGRVVNQVPEGDEERETRRARSGE